MGLHKFKSSVTRGGDLIFKEHIYIDDIEFTWEKKKGIFSKESKTFLIKDISDIEIDISLIGSTIKITSKGGKIITAENFTKSDAKEIKSIYLKAKENL